MANHTSTHTSVVSGVTKYFKVKGIININNLKKPATNLQPQLAIKTMTTVQKKTQILVNSGIDAIFYRNEVKVAKRLL